MITAQHSTPKQWYLKRQPVKFYAGLFFFFCFLLLSGFKLSGQDCHCANLVTPKVGTAVGIPTLSQAIFDSVLPSGTIATGLSLCIDGDFSIDQTYTFEDSEMNISPDTKVTIQDGSKLSIIGTEVYGCNAMWNSFYLAGTSYGWINAGIHVENSTIRDAKVAIDIGVYDDLYLDQVFFIGNHIGIRSTSFDGGVPNVLKFGKTWFTTGSNPLPPHANEIMYAGIYLNKIYGFPVGEGSDPNNSVAFLLLRNGIVADASSFTAVNCEFSTSLTTSFSTPAFVSDNWNGILMDINSRAYITESVFDNNTVGVHARNNSHVEVVSNYFNETIGYGVYVKDNWSGWVTVKDNDLICFKSAVQLSNLQNTLVEISGNTIEMREESDQPNQDGSSSIYISGSNFYDFGLGFNRRALILDNTIDLLDAPFGITLLSSTGVDVLGTETAPISFKPNNGNFDFSHDAFSGIMVFGGGDHAISGNSIIGEGPAVSYSGPGSLVTGIRSFTSDFNSFCGNSVNDLEIGVRFDGSNMGAKFQGTNFGSHDVALSMDADGVIGVQVGADNRWNISSLDKGARHENPNPLFSTFSQFRVDAYGMPVTPTYPSGIDPDPSTTMIDWFFNNGSIAKDCTAELTPIEDPSSLDVSIAEGLVISGTAFSNTTKWQLERYLFSKLDRNPALAQEHPSLSAFDSLHQFSNIGKLHKLRRDIDELALVPAVEVTQYQSNMDSLARNLSRLADISKAMPTATPGQVDSLMTTRQGILQNINAWERASDSLLTIIEAYRYALIQQYLSDNASLTTLAIYEENEQEVNDIFLNTVEQGLYTFTTSQINSLDSISSQCPKLGGNAVYRARALYHLIEERIYNDEEICSPFRSAESEISKEDEYTTTPEGVKIYPNPAHSELFIQLAGLDEVDRVEIISLSGQIMLFQGLRDESQQEVRFYVGDMPAGIYFVQVKQGNRLLSTKKVVIQR